MIFPPSGSIEGHRIADARMFRGVIAQDQGNFFFWAFGTRPEACQTHGDAARRPGALQVGT